MYCHADWHVFWLGNAHATRCEPQARSVNVTVDVNVGTTFAREEKHTEGRSV